jgi:PHS family inorganic phosphate transporter-like MFS transporter
MFVVNLVFWGYAWNLGTIFLLIGYVDPNWSLGTINFAVAVGVLIVAFGGIPGFFASITFIEKIGRKNLHLLGFGGMTLINLILGFAFDRVKTTSPHLFVWLLTLESVFAHLAPNGTVLTQFNPTMADPEQEPSSKGYYSTALVLGLIASQFLFAYTKNIGGTSAFINYLFQIYSYLSISALLLTFLLPDPQPFERNKA